MTRVLIISTYWNSLEPPLSEAVTTSHYIAAENTTDSFEDLCTEEQVFYYLFNLETRKANGPDGNSPLTNTSV